jgi:hypothetical protein
LKGSEVGNQSYHFDKEESYISFLSNAAQKKLDNGDPLPDKQPISSFVFTPENRTFRGTVDWSPTTFEDNTIWDLEIVFSEDFLTFETGIIVFKDANEKALSDKVIGKGTDFVYQVQRYEENKLSKANSLDQ